MGVEVLVKISCDHHECTATYQATANLSLITINDYYENSQEIDIDPHLEEGWVRRSKYRGYDYFCSEHINVPNWR